MPLLSGVRRHSILSRLTNTEGYPGPGCALAELSVRTRLCTVFSSSAERAAECGRERWLVLPVHPLPLLVRVIECILTFE